MAGAGAKKFAAFSKLASDDVNNYLADQVIMRFATTAARDAAFGGVGEPTLAEGMTAYIDADNSIYTYDGSNWVKMVSASQPVGLWLVSSSSFSAVTEILVDSVFTSAYRNYRINFDCQSSAGGAIFAFQMRGGGSTIATSTYQCQALNIENTVVSASRSITQTQIRVGANDVGGYHAMTVDMFCPQLAQPTRINTVFNRNSGFQSETAYASNTNSTAYDGFRISVGSGTMTGAYNVYGFN